MVAKPANGFCLNCDNRHGCKSGPPPCLAAMREKSIVNRSGKDYLTETKKILSCQACPFFRSCWSGEEYDRLLRDESST